MRLAALAACAGARVALRALCVLSAFGVVSGCSSSDCPSGTNANSLFCHATRTDAGIDTTSDVRTDVTADVGCHSDGDCPAGQHCNLSTNRCATGCNSNADCASTPATPVCDTTRHICVGCLGDGDCPPGQHCNPSTHACETGCRTNADCAPTPATPICDTTTHACVGCVMDSDCPTHEICNMTMHRCVVGCRTNSDCASTPATPVCDLTTSTCVRCAADTDCPLGQVCHASMCVDGCTVSARCPSGQACCSMACVDTQTSLMNCGACGNTCTVMHGTPGCTAGACTIASCDTGFADCDHLLPDGCEVNTQTDPLNCGACGMACSLAHATSTCTAGHCAITTCDAGFADCDGVAGNGCETALNTTMNCGTCGHACPSPQMCVSGACALVCAPLTICGTVCIDTMTSVTNCGSCGHTCPAPPNATATCTAGVCGFRCNTGFADCDGLAVDGCEVNTQTDVGNCGACRNACSLPNATPACSGGHCVISSCNTGFGDCDGIAANGCETDLTSDAHCGSCGNNCGGPGSGYCFGGSCARWPFLRYFGGVDADCGDIGPDHSGGGFILQLEVDGRPGATFNRECRHASCGFSSWGACPRYPGETNPLPPSGTYSYTDSGGGNCTSDPTCMNGVAGQWESRVTIDGHTFSGAFFTFMNSCCSAFNTCSSAGTYCQPCCLLSTPCGGCR